MFNFKAYKDNPELFTVQSLPQKSKDDATISILYKQYDEFSGVSTDMSIQLNHFKLQQQSVYFAQKIIELTEQKQQIDNFLSDCAKGRGELNGRQTDH